MKKLLTLCMLLCMVFTGAWAQISEIVTSTKEAPKPLYMYVDNSEVSYVTTGLKIYGSNGAGSEAKGKFILIATATEGEYNIYETTTQKYVAMKSGATTNMKSGTEMVDVLNENCVWVIARYGTQAAWTIKPKSLGAYMNYNGGPSGNKSGQTIGFWTNGSSDTGSRWYFERADGNEIRYVTIETAATNRGQYIFNDIRLTGVGLFTYQNCSNASHTTNPVPAFSTDNSCYVWRINDQYGTTYSEIMNGAGYTIKGTDAEHSTLYPRTGTKTGYDYFMFGITGDGCLNASDHNGYSKNYLDAVTNWNTTAGAGKDDNLWKVQDVDLTGKTIYNIMINGVAADTHPYVTYNNDQHAGNGGFFIASSVVAQNQLTASELSGYKEPVIEVEGTTITVTYEPDPYTVAFDKTTTYTGADLAWQRAIKNITIGGVTKNVAEYAEDASSKMYCAYRDLTETCVFNIAAGEALNAKVTIGSTDNKTWSNAYIYIDADESEQFTIADPDELYASLTGAGAITDFNNTFANTLSVPATEGTYRMRIVLGAQDPAGNAAAFTTNMNRIVDVTLKVVDVTGLQDKIDETMNAIYGDAIGYPNRNNASNNTAINNLHDFQSMSAALPVNAANYDEALAALNAVYHLTGINLPQDGKAYKIWNVMSNGDKRAVYYNGTNMKTGTTMNPDAATEGDVFICHHLSDNNFVFVAPNNGYYMHLVADGKNQVFNETYTEANNKVSITKMPASTTASGSDYSAANVENTFGLVLIKGNIGDGSNLHYLMGTTGSKFANTKAGGLYFTATAQSSGFAFEEVENPNKVKLTCPNTDVKDNHGLNGKYVGTFSAPYNVKLSSEVIAYTAEVEGNKVTFNELGNVVPKNIGVLLYAPVAAVAITKDAVPAIEDLPDMSDRTNALVGTNGAESTVVDKSVNAYILSKDEEEGVKFYPLADSDRTIARNKAYLVLTASGVTAFRFDFEEEQTTGVEAIEAQQGVKKAYDIAGRSVNASKHGLYIIGGNKVIR